MKVQYNIITTQNLPDRVNNILQTWGSSITDIIFYSDHQDSDKNIVKATVSENTGQYNSCPEKIYHRLKQIKENNIFDWYVFVDDDTFVNVKNVITFLQDANKDCSYGSSANWGHPQGGAGFFISNSTIDKITLKCLSEYTETRFSDELIGYIFQDNDLVWTWTGNLLHNATTMPQLCKTVMTLHPVTTKEDMECLYTLSQQNEN
jgi:hypothetical protein